MKKILKITLVLLLIFTMAFACYQSYSAAVEPPSPTDYKVWTFADGGVADGSLELKLNDTGDGFKPAEARAAIKVGGVEIKLDKSMFVGYVSIGDAFPQATNGVDFNNGPYIGLSTGSNLTTYDGRKIDVGLGYKNGKTYFAYHTVHNNGSYDVNVSKAFEDTPIALGEEFLLQVSFDYIDYDNDGVKDDLKVGFIVNGKLAGGDYVYIINHAADENARKAFLLRYVNKGFTEDRTITTRSAYKADASNLTNGTAYCGGVVAQFTSEAADKKAYKDVYKVLADGNAVAITNGKATIPGGTKKVEVFDYLGNKNTYNVTVNNDHTWSSQLLPNNDATCTKNGTKSKICLLCRAKDTAHKVTIPNSKAAHSFTKYVSNNDQTCVDDGHTTATCDYAGCNAKHTKLVVGSATKNHIYGNDNFCDICGIKKEGVTGISPSNFKGGKPSGTTSPITGESIIALSILAIIGAVVFVVNTVLKKKRQAVSEN